MRREVEESPYFTRSEVVTTDLQHGEADERQYVLLSTRKGDVE